MVKEGGREGSDANRRSKGGIARRVVHVIIQVTGTYKGRKRVGTAKIESG
jgi:hypothetical protein